MKIEYVDSLGLPKGFRVSQYETLAELVKAAGSEAVVVDNVNKYLRQKGPLVAARDELSTAIEKLGFPMKVTTVKKDGKDIEQPDETEGKHISRFIAAVVAGSFVPPGWTITGTNDEQKEAGVMTKLQEMADKLGDVDDAGKLLTTPPSFVCDIKVPERTSKAKNPPKYAIEGATNIINAKNTAQWKDRFTKGYKAATGETIVPFAFQAFDTAAPTGATPEVIEATRQQNITNLAWAISNVEEQKRAQRAQAEYK